MAVTLQVCKKLHAMEGKWSICFRDPPGLSRIQESTPHFLHLIRGKLACEGCRKLRVDPPL